MLSSEVLALQANRNLQKADATFCYTSKYYCTFGDCRPQVSLLTVHSWYSKLCRGDSVCSKHIRGFKILIGSAEI